jgi:hypothetical protein
MSSNLLASLIGRQIATSSRVQSLISELVSEVGRLEQNIETVRPPVEGLQDSAKKAFDEAGKYRGRPLFYPYLGTGAGHGPYVEIEDGSVKLDLINGIGVHIMGHSHPKVIEASLRGALCDVVMQGNLEPNYEYSMMGKKLVEHASKNSRLKYAWVSTCGTMANENALKMARQKHSPARMVVGMKNAFAGRSTMMAEVTDNPAYKQGLPDYNEVLRIPWYEANDPRSSEKTLNALKEHVAKHPKNISAFVFEPMLGEGGYRSAPREFFVPLLEFCKQNNIAIWRFGSMKSKPSCEQANCSLSKHLGSGSTLICALSQKLFSVARPFTPKSTIRNLASLQVPSPARVLHSLLAFGFWKK